MKKIHDSIRWFRSSILGEYIPLLLVVAGLGGSFYLATLFVSDKAGVREEESQSGDHVPVPSIGISEAYAEYAKTFETYKSDLGFSFKYPPHLAVTITPDMPDSNWVVLESSESTEENISAIIVSIGLNDERMTPEEWLLDPTSTFKHSDKYFKTKIDGQDAVYTYTDGGMWTVVNTPDNKYRLSIAELSLGQVSRLFSEMGIVVESLTFRR